MFTIPMESPLDTVHNCCGMLTASASSLDILRGAHDAALLTPPGTLVALLTFLFLPELRTVTITSWTCLPLSVSSIFLSLVLVCL